MDHQLECPIQLQSHIVGFDVNEEKTKNMLTSCLQNFGRNYNTNIANKSFQIVSPNICERQQKIKHNCFHERIKSNTILSVLNSNQTNFK
jgi:hypothetical protein